MTKKQTVKVKKVKSKKLAKIPNAKKTKIKDLKRITRTSSGKIAHPGLFPLKEKKSKKKHDLQIKELILQLKAHKDKISKRIENMFPWDIEPRLKADTEKFEFCWVRYLHHEALGNIEDITPDKYDFYNVREARKNGWEFCKLDELELRYLTALQKLHVKTDEFSIFGAESNTACYRGQILCKRLKKEKIILTENDYKEILGKEKFIKHPTGYRLVVEKLKHIPLCESELIWSKILFQSNDLESCMDNYHKFNKSNYKISLCKKVRQGEFINLAVLSVDRNAVVDTFTWRSYEGIEDTKLADSMAKILAGRHCNFIIGEGDIEKKQIPDLENGKIVNHMRKTEGIEEYVPDPNLTEYENKVKEIHAKEGFKAMNDFIFKKVRERKKENSRELEQKRHEEVAKRSALKSKLKAKEEIKKGLTKKALSEVGKIIKELTKKRTEWKTNFKKEVAKNMRATSKVKKEKAKNTNKAKRKK